MTKQEKLNRKMLMEIKKKFDKLTYSEKLRFYFEDVLPDFNFDINKPILWNEFYNLDPKNRNEEKALEEWTIKHYAKHDEACNLEKLKNDFNELYNKAGDKKLLIDYKLDKLERKYILTYKESCDTTSEKYIEKHSYDYYSHKTDEPYINRIPIEDEDGNKIERGGFFFHELPKMRGKVSALYKDFLLEKKIFYIPDEKELNSNRQNKPNFKKKQIKSFADWLNLPNKEEQDKLANAIKKKYNGEKGRKIALLIIALEKSELLQIQNREQNDLYKSMKDFFKWNIGTNTGLNSIRVLAKAEGVNPKKGTQEIYKPDIEKIINEITQLINQ